MRFSRYVVAVGLACGLLGCGEDSIKRSPRELVIEGDLRFGPTALGAIKTKELTLKNEGRATLQLSAIRSTVPNVVPVDFSELELGSGESTKITVAFEPIAEGEVSGLLAVETDLGPDGDGEVELSGLGVKSFAVLRTEQLDFGNVEIGTVKLGAIEIQNPTLSPARYRIAIAGSDAEVFSSAQVQTPVLLESGQTSEIFVAFSPDELGSAEALATLTPCDGCEPEKVFLTGTGITTGLEITPTRVNFGHVSVGATARQTVTIRNRGVESLQYSGVRLLAGDGSFSLGAQPPANTPLEPDTTIQVEVIFRPSAIGPAKAASLELGIKARPNARFPRLPVAGEGGTSCVTISPNALDFGLVPEGMTQRRDVEVLNRCLSPIQVSNLALTTSEGGVFSLPAGNTGFEVAAGGTSRLNLEFTPNAGTPVSKGELVVEYIDAGKSGSTVLPLKGESRAVPPCEYELTPTELDFGSVALGSEVVRGSTFTNVGTTECFLTGAQMVAGSDPEFGTVSNSPRRVAPGESVLLKIRFRGKRERSYAGTAEAWVNNPTRGRLSFSLRANAVAGCLTVQPTTIDYGTTKLSCTPRVREVTALNACEAPVTVTSAALTPNSSQEFSLASWNPTELEPGKSTTFSITYDPKTTGEDSGGLQIDSTGGAHAVGFVARGNERGIQFDRFRQENRSKVDVLFVIDNSGSMMEEQYSLAENFAAFLSEAQRQYIDYHIAVTTTGMEPSAGGTVTCPGGVNGAEAGRLFPVSGETPRVITTSTPAAANVFADNVQVGWCHWNEQGLQSAYAALSHPLLNAKDDPTTPEPNDGNAGFLRDDAKLAIVFVTDEEDFSLSPVAFYETYFKALKRNDPSLLTISAIAGPNDLSTCLTASSSGTRYIELANATGGVVESICTPNWASSLRNLSANAFAPKKIFRLRETPANPSAIQVKVNGQTATGWHFDVAANSIVFRDDTVPAAGAIIDITYELGCE